MPKKISNEKQNLIRKRLLQGHSQSDIADEVGVNIRTIRRYVKSAPLPSTSLGSEDTHIQVDYSTILTKREEALTKKIQAEINLYEDPAEGWVYHLTKHDDRIRQQGLWWQFVCYPESVPENWLERLRNTHMQIAISPLHDKDSWNHDSPEMINPDTGEIIPKGARYKVGDRKKAHWHGIVKCDQKTSWREMNTLLQSITNCPYIQKCKTLKGAYDYFLHINHPERYQGYDKSEIIKMNGFVIEATKYERSILYDEIAKNVLEHHWTRWTEVVRHYHGQLEYMDAIINKPSVVGYLLTDNWREQHPEGKVQRVKLIENESEV